MEFTKTRLNGVLLIKPDVYEDFRGSYTETYNQSQYKKNGVQADFVVDAYSVSSKNVLRGMHGDETTWKLIDCRYGRFYLVVLNFDQNSAQYGEWESFILSGENKWQVLVPPKFANGHLALTDAVTFHYKKSEYYNPKGEFTIRYNDPRFKIYWPSKTPLLSRRDDIT